MERDFLILFCPGKGSGPRMYAGMVVNPGKNQETKQIRELEPSILV